MRGRATRLRCPTSSPGWLLSAPAAGCWRSAAGPAGHRAVGRAGCRIVAVELGAVWAAVAQPTWPASPRSRWPWPRSRTGRCRPSRSVVVAATAWHWLTRRCESPRRRGAAAGWDAGHGRDPSRRRWRRGLLHPGAGRYSAGTQTRHLAGCGCAVAAAAVAHNRTNWTTRPVRAGRLPPLRPGPGVHDRRVSGSAPIVFGERVTGRHRVRLSSAAIEVAARYANPHRCTRAGRTTQSRAHQDKRSAVIVGFALEAIGGPTATSNPAGPGRQRPPRRPRRPGRGVG